MTEDSDFPRCYLCGTTESLDEHHVVMQAAGGTHGQTVRLCATHHQAIHSQAKNLLARNAARRQYVPDHLMARAAPLIRVALRSLRQIQEERPAGVPVRLMVELEPAVHDALHRLKRDAGYTNVGDYAANILIKHVRSQI